MFNELPAELQYKIRNYIYELDVSKKKQHFKLVHHELLYGWWYVEYPNKRYHVMTNYSEDPTIVTHLSLEEIYKLYSSQSFEWKPILTYLYYDTHPPIIDYDIEYCFADRLPKLLSLS